MSVTSRIGVHLLHAQIREVLAIALRVSVQQQCGEADFGEISQAVAHGRNHGVVCEEMSA